MYMYCIFVSATFSKYILALCNFTDHFTRARNIFLENYKANAIIYFGPPFIVHVLVRHTSSGTRIHRNIL